VALLANDSISSTSNKHCNGRSARKEIVDIFGIMTEQVRIFPIQRVNRLRKRDLSHSRNRSTWHNNSKMRVLTKMIAGKLHRTSTLV
jgi:siroheme synthase (precorrin-2 oxidase/ferrochelatase)